MPRNDQLTRQWHLLRQLEATVRGPTLRELAEVLPAGTRKPLRTIRRDPEALKAAGFPLLTERIEGRVVRKLLEGFRRVPALTFSPTELMALTFSRGLLQPLEGTQLQAALDSALARAAAALPAPAHGYLRQLDGLFAIGLGPPTSYRARPGDHRPAHAGYRPVGAADLFRRLHPVHEPRVTLRAAPQRAPLPILKESRPVRPPMSPETHGAKARGRAGVSLRG